MKLIKFLQATLVAFFFAGTAFAQTSGTVSNHAIAVGKGPGQTGFTSVSCADKLFLSGVAGLDPACRAIVGADLPFPGVSSLGGVKSLAAVSNQFLTGLGTDGVLTRAQPAFSNLSGSATCAQLPALTGDVTTSAGSCATAIGAGKVTNTMLAAMTSAQLAGIISDETGTGALVFANSPVFTTPNLGTPSAVTLTNGTGLPIATGVSGLGAGVAAFLQTPSSANLAAAVTNETGSGALVFGTAPNITNPTGIVKADVGLGNVDNTSDATKNAATATLTNKTISGANNTLTVLAGSQLSGQVPVANGGTGATSISSALDTAFSNTQGSVLYRNATQWVALAPGTAGQFLTTQGAGANPNWSSGGAGTGTVTSVAAGVGLSASPSPITASGTLSVALTSATNSMGANVNLNNTANYFDGPSMAQGTSGTWLATGTVTLTDTAGAAHFDCKLWDGTTVISSTRQFTPTANTFIHVTLSGILAAPAGNIRISCKDITSTSGMIVFNASSNSTDSKITGVRIAQ